VGLNASNMHISTKVGSYAVYPTSFQALRSNLQHERQPLLFRNITGIARVIGLNKDVSWVLARQLISYYSP